MKNNIQTNIRKASIPQHLNHESTIADILLASGFCTKAQIEQAALVVQPDSGPARSYLTMLSEYETSKEQLHVAHVLVDSGVISTNNREYALRVQSILRVEHAERNCPAAQFRRFQDALRDSLKRLLGGRMLDEATPEVSHYPYASTDATAQLE